jgi:hypothetical protein
MRLAPVIGYLILAFGTLFAIVEVSNVAEEAHEATERIEKSDKASAVRSSDIRDQVCQVFESQHQADVQALRDTYKYLDTVVKRGETASTLNQFIIRGLPVTEAEARRDPAPQFCDGPGLGLPEPDPVLPGQRDFSKYVTK